MTKDARFGRRSTTRALRSVRCVDGARSSAEIPGLKSINEMLAESSEDGDDAFLMVMAVGEGLDDDRHFRTRAAKSDSLLSPAAFAQQKLLPIKKSERNGFSHMITLGRSENNDVVLPFGQISKLHAYFARGADGAWTVRDCGSANGSKLNGKPLIEQVPEAVRTGNELILGRAVALQFLTLNRLREYADFLAALDPREAP